MAVYEDAEHRATPMPVRAVDLCRYVYHILANDLSDAIAIAKGNPEFEYGTTARIEVRPVKMKEESTGYAYPKNTS